MRFASPEPLPILVVDDDRQMLRTIADILRLSGYSPEAAMTAGQGLELAARMPVPPAIALVDLRLPDMDGFELVTRLHSLSELTQVVILTGNASIESAVRALREQSYDYLIKPVQPERLLDSVGRAGDRWQRRNAEVAMRDSEERLRRIFEHVGDALLITDDARRIIDANAAACELTGLSIEQLRSSTLHEVLPDAAEPATDGRFPGVSPRQGERRLRGRDGQVRIVDVRETEFAPGLSVHSMRDLTSQRQLEEELHHSQKMDAIGRLAGGVAHDFNNLLTAITCYSDVLLTTFEESDERCEDLREIQKAARRAAALTGQLLAFSRKQILQPRALDLNAVVADIEKMLRRVIGEDMRLATELDPAPWTVRADPGQLGQVLLNLVVNARDAMPNGGVLRIRTGNVRLASPHPHAHGVVDAGEYVTLEVSDSGTGIDAAVLPHLFEPFFTTKGPGKGTGLGLSTVYGVLRQSDGHIEVKSSPGQGTTFVLYFPRESEETVQVVDEKTTASSNGRSATILLVEDDAPVRELVRMMLTKKGYDVLCASDGEQALTMAGEHRGRIDLLVTDVVLPGLNGREVAERLRAARPEVTVLYMSGYTDDAILRRGVLTQRSSLIQKPFSAGDLTNRVSELLAVPSQ
jgi:two-component system, cell cycle sensor histidine kinase and response regulator CckA